MIGYIKGRIEEILGDRVILDNQGIGWEIIVPAAMLDNGLHSGDEIKLYTYLHVREDAMQLFGFFSRDELEIFGMLLNVSGIIDLSFLDSLPIAGLVLMRRMENQSGLGK